MKRSADDRWLIDRESDEESVESVDIEGVLTRVEKLLERLLKIADSLQALCSPMCTDASSCTTL